MRGISLGRIGRWRGLLPAVALVLTIASCSGDRGADGVILAETTWTADVLSIDASGLGIVSAGTHPDPLLTQELTATTGTVTWSSDWQGPAVNYITIVELETVDAQEGKRGLLPSLPVEVPGVTTQDGHDGPDRTLRFHFENDQLAVYVFSSPMTGSTYVVP